MSTFLYIHGIFRSKCNPFIRKDMEAIGDILVLPFYGQGHLFPSMELCKKLTSFNFKVTLIIPYHLSSSIPPYLRHHSLIQVVEISATSTLPLPHKAIELPALPPNQKGGHGFMHGPFSHHHQQLGQGMDIFLSERCDGTGLARPICAVVDVMMSWSKEIFLKYDIPFISFFTSGACAAAMEFAAWKNHADEMKPGEIRILPGLPESMALSYSDVKRNRHGPGHLPGGGPNRKNKPSGPPGGVDDGPPKPGQKPRWLDEIEGSIALLINTCHDLEGPFIDYVANQIEKPIWGVGPLLPVTYWKSSSILQDREVRSNRQSNFTEEEVMQWLNSKPQGSVIYVSFGSEVGPSLVEYAQLADALEELNHPFIWVIRAGSGQPGPPPGLFGDGEQEEGYYPHGLKERIGNKGLIIKGWAPQLLILSHPSTGGFLSHCGLNSTMEAIGRGVPILAWPIRGDQFHNAKLVANYLKMGHMILLGDDPGEMVKKDDIVQGIDKMMKDEGVHKQAMALRSVFQSGYPDSSMCSLKSFIQLISK